MVICQTALAVDLRGARQVRASTIVRTVPALLVKHGVCNLGRHTARSLYMKQPNLNI